MRYQVYLATFLLFSAGCSPLPVRDSEIDWHFPVLSKQGCPDLSGRYLDDGIRREEMMRCTSASLTCSRAAGLFPLLIGKLEDLPEYRFEKQTPLPKPTQKDSGTVYVTIVRHTPSDIALRLQDLHGIKYSSLSAPLHHDRVGCHSGAMILRNISNLGGSEGGSGMVQYSETEIRKATDGSLLLTEWRAWRYRSKLTGKAYAEPRDVVQRSWRFEPER